MDDEKPNIENQENTIFISHSKENKKNSQSKNSLLINSETRFTEEGDIGSGGMKIITLVEDENMKRTVAKASLHSKNLNEKCIRLFVREARLTAALEHPNIVPIYEIGENSKGEPFFIMKNITGDNLRNILISISRDQKDVKKNFPLERLLKIFGEVCQTIEYAHTKNIFHLDIKPENIHISEEGKVYVVDWGLSKIILDVNEEQKLKIENLQDVNIDHNIDEIQGTPGYMAPEQISHKIGEIGPLTDVYGLGSLLYSILTLELPIGDEDSELRLRKTIAGDVVPPKRRSPELKINKDLDRIVTKAMSVLPENRYLSPNGINDDINRHLNKKANQKRYLIVAVSLCVLIACATILSSKLRIEPNKPSLVNSDGDWVGPTPKTIEELKKALLLCNPKYENDFKFDIDEKGAIVNLNFTHSAKLINISPLKGLPIKTMSLGNTGIDDISPLKGMQLRKLDLQNTKVSDLNPLKSMPLEKLWIAFTWVRDLEPLRGMPLKNLWIGSLYVDDITVLREAPLEFLYMDNTNVSDISILKDKQLLDLDFSDTNVKDISVIKGMPLKWLSLNNPKYMNPGWEEIVRSIHSLERLGTIKADRMTNQHTPSQFWKDYKK